MAETPHGNRQGGRQRVASSYGSQTSGYGEEANGVDGQDELASRIKPRCHYPDVVVNSTKLSCAASLALILACYCYPRDDPENVVFGLQLAASPGTGPTPFPGIRMSYHPDPWKRRPGIIAVGNRLSSGCAGTCAAVISRYHACLACHYWSRCQLKAYMYLAPV